MKGLQQPSETPDDAAASEAASAAASHAAAGHPSSLPLPPSLHAMSDNSLRDVMAIKLGEMAPLVEDLKQHLSSLVTTCAAIGALAITCNSLLAEHDDRLTKRPRLDGSSSNCL